MAMVAGIVGARVSSMAGAGNWLACGNAMGGCPANCELDRSSCGISKLARLADWRSSMGDVAAGSWRGWFGMAADS